MSGEWDQGGTLSLFGINAAASSPLGGVFSWMAGLSSAFNTGAVVAGTDPQLAGKIISDQVTGNDHYTPAQVTALGSWLNNAQSAWNNESWVSQFAHTASGGLVAAGGYTGSVFGVLGNGASQGAASAAGGIVGGAAKTATAGITAGIGGGLAGAMGGIGTGIASLGGGVQTLLGDTSGLLGGGGSSASLWIIGGIVLLAVVMLAS